MSGAEKEDQQKPNNQTVEQPQPRKNSPPALPLEDQKWPSYSTEVRLAGEAPPPLRARPRERRGEGVASVAEFCSAFIFFFSFSLCFYLFNV